jgi:hypothetical protein
MPAEYLHNHRQFADLIRIVAQQRRIDPACSLLRRSDVQAFIGTDAYKVHKKKRFRPADDPDITRNQAFVLADPATREVYAKAYAESTTLYFGEKPTFEEILTEIGKWGDRL